MNEVVKVTTQDHYKEIQSKDDRPYFKTPEYLEYRHMWTDYPDREIVPNLPINLDLHITNKCNLSCPFCPRTWKDVSGGFDEYGFMSMDLYRKITDEAAKGGVKAFHFTANGEPLLHRGLEEMIAYAHEKGIIDIIVHTNACGLSENRARKLLKVGMTRLAISFDSPNKETYQKLRIGASYEKTLENIKRFVRLRDELGYSLPTVRVQMVDQGANIHERKQFDEMFGEIADSTSHAVYVNYNGGPGSYVGTDVIDGSNMAIGVQKYNPDFKCKYLWQRMIIEWNGECFPCFYGFDLKVGDLRESTIHEVWHGEQMQHLRQLHSTKSYNKCSTCNNCGRQYDTVEMEEQNTADVI